MGEVVIDVRNLSKTFSVKDGAPRTIRETVKGIFKKKGRRKEIPALQDINFSVERGEVFGIIGRNGSGKSTLLNCLMGSILPDKGSFIKTKGKMLRLSLGMGFDGNLSARDNIYVNGSILGLSFKRIGLIFDDIVQFAELTDFVDVPVKHYSSGMMAKLKFSIAVHAQADIFLMDEFFGGVGDESFKAKSEALFQNTFLDGKTIILVSHGLQTIQKHCNRAMILNNGAQLTIDTAEDAVAKYKHFMQKTIKRRQTGKANS